MTGSGFDGLVVNHGGLDEVGQHLYKMVKDIDNRMNDLERDLAPLQSDWSGNAQMAYNQAKTKWDTAIAEMMQLLNDTSTTVGQSNQDYHAADVRGANQFQIGH
ncbi:MAG TPA: WXG100 family type VII secretion target [Nocardioides sp.]|uniref:WXG100 family type VII secretion target n=1 Tax=Nocardioides sp. TaxID=35761 RepID=UPI002E37A76A|nr:WXG100 family type VII secretion target [Nocardioides sp.]HEX5089619.1 WXG100 family type VII secretion target [Nocardioides sp.]